MLPILTKYLTGNWKNIFPEVEKPSRIDYLGILGSHEGGKTSFLAFINQDKKPAFIVKVLRNPNFIKYFLNERDALLYLNSLDKFLNNSIPKVILCKKINNCWTLVESILDGEAMNIHLAKNNLPDLKKTEANFNLIKNWLVGFNLRLRRETLISDNLIKDYFLNIIEKFKKIFALDKLEEEYLKKILNKVADHKGKTVNLFFRHGDFCRQNILVSDSKIKLIDWEFSQKDSLPLYDVFFFLVTYYQQLGESGRINGRLNCLKRTFFEENDYSNLVRQLIIGYCKELKIKENLIKLFFTLLLLDRAVFEYQNLEKLSEKGFIPLLPNGLEKRDSSYLDKIKDQIWINFFRFIVKNDSRFIL